MGRERHDKDQKSNRGRRRHRWVDASTKQDWRDPVKPVRQGETNVRMEFVSGEGSVAV